jgi:HEAT repeat protein
MNVLETSKIRTVAGILALALGMPVAGQVRALAATRILGDVTIALSGAGTEGIDDERDQREEELYESGTDSIDESHWQEAAEKFDQVIKLHGRRADAALYWKAWAQNKLGHRSEALTTLEELKRTAPQSRWVNDAKALEIEIRQASNQTVSPESQSDCELKLLAINGLQQMDPERAVPMLEKMLHGNACPKLRGQALFVLAQSNSPQGREIIAKAARNTEDPDLQRKAIQDLGLFSGEWGRQQLSEIYATAKDNEIKKRILGAFMVAGDRGHLLALAKDEKDPVLRGEAIQQLGLMGARDDVWQIYQKETSVEVKKKVLQAMWISGDMDHVVQLAKTEKERELRLAAIQDLGLMGDRAGDTLVGMYNADKDPEVRRAVIQGLFLSGNAKALVALARKESDPDMKKALVRQLSLMQSKEATDYLMEILNK